MKIHTNLVQPIHLDEKVGTETKDKSTVKSDDQRKSPCTDRKECHKRDWKRDVKRRVHTEGFMSKKRNHDKTSIRERHGNFKIKSTKKKEQK